VQSELRIYKKLKQLHLSADSCSCGEKPAAEAERRFRNTEKGESKAVGSRNTASAITN
jgi:hypothetical protein